VIARSNEAKDIGIKMGAPAFEMEELISKHKVAVFSSNYALYGDMSRRVMTSLSQFAPEMEIYSIDEAFLNLKGFENKDLSEYGRKIVATTTKYTGMPISIGIAPTKTLAKVANKIAKKNPSHMGAFVLQDKSETIRILKEIPVEEIWGVGRQHAKFLNKHNISTAFEFTQANKEWIKKHLTIMGLRTQEELKGNPCIELETSPTDKKAICTARSFGTMLADYEPLSEAIANYAASCAAKLRKQSACASLMMVFVHTNPFRKDLKQYARNIVINLPVASNSSMELISNAEKGLKAIYKKGYFYKKAGVIVSDLIPESSVQTGLFDKIDRDKKKKIMEAVDKLNKKMGKDKIRIAKQGYSRQWKLRQEKLSPSYTTKMDEILIVKL
jgi:DNA polymerase V